MKRSLDVHEEGLRLINYGISSSNRSCDGQEAGGRSYATATQDYMHALLRAVWDSVVRTEQAQPSQEGLEVGTWIGKIDFDWCNVEILGEI